MQVQLGYCLRRWKWPLEPLNGKIVCRIYGPVHKNTQCGIHYINEICGLYKGVYVVTHTTFGLSWSSGGGVVVAAAFMCSMKYASRCVVFL
jgi:hypothetical protein